MHCSSCETLLDRYVEGSLRPRQMAEVGAHVKSCAACSALLEELKVVDGLLFTTRVPDLPPNFTFAVMAEANTMPVPKAPPTRVWSFLALYLTAAWAMAVIWVSTTGVDPRTLAEAAVLQGNRFVSAVGSLSVPGHALAQSPLLVATGLVVLALDVALAAAAIVFFTLVRPRLAARPVRIGQEVE